MERNCLKLFLCAVLIRMQLAIAQIPRRACETYHQPGDAIVGGIFPIYRTGASPCDGGLRQNRISMVQALSYAVKMINERDDILQNVTLGFEVRNDCSDDDISLWTAITMTSYEGNKEYEVMCPNHVRGNTKKVFGIIGTSRSSTSLLASKVGGVYAVPIVSYYATSDVFSDYSSYPYFFRTISPDKFQIGVIVDILQFYEWKYVALFYSIDTYGIHGARQIRKLAEDLDICVAISLPVSDQASTKEIRDIADKLRDHEHVSVIISFSLWPTTHAVLQAIRDHSINRKFTFVGSDGWGPDIDDSDTEGFKEQLLGGLFVRVYSPSTPNFHSYYRQLPYRQDQASQWYRDKLAEIGTENNCTEWASCPIPEAHLETRIIDAVYALAYALDASVRGSNCHEGRVCDEALIGSVIQSELLHVNFVTERNSTFEFDANGDKSGKYKIKHWQQKNGEFVMVDVGIWDPEKTRSRRLHLDDNLVQWDKRYGGIKPISICSEQCKPGYEIIPIEKKCCWGCRKCPDYAIVVSTLSNNINNASCYECPVTRWPDSNFTSCIIIKPSYIHPKNAAFVISSVGAGVGLILTLLAGLGLWHYSDHSLIKASSRELCCVHITGMVFTCLVVLGLLLRPSRITCIIMEVCMSTCVCVTFTPILLKVVRIWRIFSTKKAKRPSFIGPEHQIGFSLLLITIQITISCVSIFFAASRPSILFPPKRSPFLEIHCKFGYGFLISSAYSMLIIATCCYFAFRARKVPSNYNESKFIGISVYSSFIVGLAGVVVYNVADTVALKTGTLNVILLFNTYLTLTCLYIPKLYIIYIDSEEANQTWRTQTGPSLNNSINRGVSNQGFTVSVLSSNLPNAPSSVPTKTDDFSTI